MSTEAQRQSALRAARIAWEKTTKFRHPHKVRLKWLFRNMVNRCHKPSTKCYPRYGGKGIRVVDEWRLNPTAFYEWAVANGYKPGLEIDREDSTGPYAPWNCRFVDDYAQANNTSKNRWLQWNGERLTVSQWARKLGVRQQALSHRIERGWSNERIFTQPFRCRL